MCTSTPKDTLNSKRNVKKIKIEQETVIGVDVPPPPKFQMHSETTDQATGHIGEKEKNKKKKIIK